MQHSTDDPCRPKKSKARHHRLRSSDLKFFTLDVVGFVGSTSGLVIAPAFNGWVDDADIDAALANLNEAIGTLRTGSASLPANLSVITIRQDFTTNMVNTLTGGADKLTLDDMNEEGANMLMLQTRQALGTTALSLAS